MAPTLKLMVLLLVSGQVRSNYFEKSCLEAAIGSGKLGAYFGGFCYLMNPTKFELSQALGSCNDLPHGRLAFATNQKQFQFIAFEFDIKSGVWNAITKSSCQSNDTCDTSQEWLYVNGGLTSLIIPNLWEAGHPNTAGDAAILTEQGYTVANSTQKYPALCQYRMIQIECGTLCHQEASTNCASYGYNPHTGTCLLHWLPYEALNLAPAANFILMEREKKEIDAYSCPSVSNASNAVTYNKNKTHGRLPDEARAAIKCAAGERTVLGKNAKNSSVHTCVAPYWVPPASLCVPVCETKQVNSTGAPQQYSDGSAPNRSVLTVTCDAGHYVNNSNFTSASAICNGKNWLPNLPHCRKKVQDRWSLVTKTGADDPNGGCNCQGKIYVKIYGTEGTSRQIFLTNGKSNYGVGKEDTFILGTEELGTVLQLEVGTTHGWDGWYVDWMQLHDIARAHTYNFTCNFWIDKDRGDRQHDILTPD